MCGNGCGFCGFCSFGCESIDGENVAAATDAATATTAATVVTAATAQNCSLIELAAVNLRPRTCCLGIIGVGLRFAIKREKALRELWLLEGGL